MIEAVPISEVVIPEKRLRGLKDVSDLVGSIAAVGLITPISVTTDCPPRLIAGLRRITACRQLGWERIPAIPTDANAELVEIDENLCRVELTALERAQHLARRKQVWEALYPATRHGTNQHTKGDAPPSFAASSAQATKQSGRTIRRAVKIAEGLDDEAADLISGTPTADNQQELQRLARLPVEDQRAVAQLLADGEVTRVKVAQRRLRASKPLPDLAGDVPASVQIRCCTAAEMVGELAEAGTTVGFVTADPPWPYKNQRINGSTDGHYDDGASEGYGLEDIARDIDAAYDVAADDCYLALWVTGPFLWPWFEAVQRFGIDDIEPDGEDPTRFRWEYVGAGVWNKRPDNTGRIGSGTHWRGDGEFLLLYRKGKPAPLATISNAHVSDRTEHSEKPGIFCYNLVKAFCPPGTPVLDLFCGRAPTARACLGLVRPYYGCDTDEARVHDAKAAIEEARRPGRESTAAAKAAGVQVTS